MSSSSPSVLLPALSISHLHATMDTLGLLDTEGTILHGNSHACSDFTPAALLCSLLFWKVYRTNSLFFQDLYSPTASTRFSFLLAGQLGGTSLMASSSMAAWTCFSEPMVGRKRHFDLLGLEVHTSQFPSSSPIQSKRLSFTSGLHPLVIKQHAVSFGQLESRPFDYLVHLVCSLIHPEDIMVGLSSIQIEDILCITSTSPLYAYIHPIIASPPPVLAATSTHPS